MRLFVAAELPPEMIEALSETSALLRSCVQGRFVGPDLFHVTLAFLGEVPYGEVSRAAAALERACVPHAPFVTTLGELGTFGRARSAVLWQGFAAGHAAWRTLAACVRGALDEESIRYDGKGFLPHVTLMRRADVSAGALPMPCVETGAVDTVTLFSSDLSGQRPRYEALERISLR